MDAGLAKPPASDGSVAVEDAPQSGRLPWPMLAWFLALLVILFFPVLQRMVLEWWVDSEQMGHAFFVPIVAGYIVWLDRERILATPTKTCWPAMILVAWGFCQMLLGFLGADYFLARTAFLISLVGVIWTIAGTKVIRALAFPLFLLLFMIRIPQFLFQQLTFPLQNIASSLATEALNFIGIPVSRDGNVLELPGRTLGVVEACSGIRSMLSLSFLSLAYAYFFDKRVWMRPVLFLSTIPIAIFTNGFRVTMTGIVGEYKREWAEGFFHSMEGWMVFMLALFCLMGLHKLINRFTRSSNA